MKKSALLLIVVMTGSISAFADQSYKFNLSNGKSATLTVKTDGLPSCQDNQDPQNEAGKIIVGSKLIAADLCIDKADSPPSILGMYAFSDTQSSSFHILTGNAMDAELNQVLIPNYSQTSGLGNGQNGKCPNGTSAILTISGKHIGDSDKIGGYCLITE